MTNLNFKNTENDQGDADERWALAHFYKAINSEATLPWEMPIVDTECPDFLIDRTDGSTLGIEVTGIYTTSEIGKDRKKAELEIQTRQQIRDIVGEPIHLNIRWLAMDGFPPVQQLVEEITHIAKCVPDLPLFVDGETFRLTSGEYWKVRAQRSVGNAEEHPASQSYPQWV